MEYYLIKVRTVIETPNGESYDDGLIKKVGTSENYPDIITGVELDEMFDPIVDENIEITEVHQRKVFKFIEISKDKYYSIRPVIRTYHDL